MLLTTMPVLATERSSARLQIVEVDQNGFIYHTAFTHTSHTKSFSAGYVVTGVLFPPRGVSLSGSFRRDGHFAVPEQTLQCQATR